MKSLPVLLRSVRRKIRKIYIEEIAPDSGLYAFRPKMAVLSEYVESPSPIIVDAGAHYGQTTASMLSTFSDATVHAIEPHPENAERLKERWGAESSVTIHTVALGAADKEVTLHVPGKTHSASMLKPARALGDFISTDITESHTVQQERLDQIVDHADILKLDLQGGELSALKGAQSLLDEVSVVISEVQFQPLYEGAPLFCDIQEYLSSHKFEFINLFEPFSDSNGRLTYADGLWISDDISK